MKRSIIIKTVSAAAAVLTLGMMVLWAGCSKPNDGRQSETEVTAEITSAPTDEAVRKIDVPNVQGVKETAGNITVLVPDGWHLEPGGPGGKQNDDSVFVVNGDAQGAPYIWVQKQTIGNIQSSVASSSSAEIEPFSINGVKWQGKSAAFYGEPGGELYIIMMHPSLSYEDDNVLAVVGSLCGA